MPSGKTNKATSRKLMSSYLTTTISISLVLFLVGMVGLLLLNASRLSDYVKENVGLTVMLREDAPEPQIRMIEKTLQSSSMVKKATYVDKAQAAEDMVGELGADFVEALGYNPLLSSIQVKVYADYATDQGLLMVENLVKNFPEVEQVYYQRDVVNLISENVTRITLILLALTAIMLVVALTLINNTVRLMVYSKRFLIRTMQLVGATNSFIRRPFVGSSILQGLVGGLIANLLIAAAMYFSAVELNGVVSFDDLVMVSLLFGGVFVVGVLITMVSTLRSVNRYLNVRTADLYV